MRNNFYLAVDIGASKIKIGVIDSLAEVHGVKTITTNLADPETTLEMLEAEVGAIKSRFKMTACGIGAPGPIAATGTIDNAPNMEKWNGINLKDEFKKMIRTKIFIDRDSRNAMRGERWLGELKNISEAVMLTWGSGIGGSILMDKKIYYGPSGEAGELGHIIVDAHGDECKLGHRGCLEMAIGGKAVEKRYGQSLAEVCQNARDKQSAALKIVDEISLYFNQAIETYIQIFNPEKIVIGGAVSRSLPLFINHKTDSRVVASSLGADAGFFGSAYLAITGGR